MFYIMIKHKMANIMMISDRIVGRIDGKGEFLFSLPIKKLFDDYNK